MTMINSGAIITSYFIFIKRTYGAGWFITYYKCVNRHNVCALERDAVLAPRACVTLCVIYILQSHVGIMVNRAVICLRNVIYEHVSRPIYLVCRTGHCGGRL